MRVEPVVEKLPACRHLWLSPCGCDPTGSGIRAGRYTIHCAMGRFAKLTVKADALWAKFICSTSCSEFEAREPAPPPPTYPPPVRSMMFVPRGTAR